MFGRMHWYIGIGQAIGSLWIFFDVGVHRVVDSIGPGLASLLQNREVLREGASELVVMTSTKIIKNVCVKASFGELVCALAGGDLVDHGRRANRPSLGGVVVHRDHTATGSIHGDSGEVRVLAWSRAER